MSVFSGFNSFRSALRDNETIVSLIELLRISPELTEEIIRRVLTLLNQNDKPQYAHPHDTALSSYLYVLHVVQPGLAGEIAEQLASTPNLFWTRDFVEEILASEVATIQSDFPATGIAKYPSFRSNARSTVKLWSYPIVSKLTLSFPNQAAGHTSTRIPSKSKRSYHTYA